MVFQMHYGTVLSKEAPFPDMAGAAGVDRVTFNTGAALLDALVLSVVSRSDTYGYRITQDVRAVVEVSESTLYPVLRRLQKDGYLAAYDQEYAGRNRRYYTITAEGEKRLAECRKEWKDYEAGIENLMFGGASDE